LSAAVLTAFGVFDDDGRRPPGVKPLLRFRLLEDVEADRNEILLDLIPHGAIGIRFAAHGPGAAAVVVPQVDKYQLAVPSGLLACLFQGVAPMHGMFDFVCRQSFLLLVRRCAAAFLHRRYPQRRRTPVASASGRHASRFSPCGGYKHSGIGRENGLESLKEYTQVKSVWVELSGMTRDRSAPSWPSGSPSDRGTLPVPLPGVRAGLQYGPVTRRHPLALVSPLRGRSAPLPPAEVPGRTGPHPRT
jgi:hypothetical protein